MTWLLTHKKIIGQLAAVVGLLVALYQLYDYVYDSGYQAAVTEIKSQYNEKIEQAREEYQKKVQTALDTQAKQYEAELERARAEREIITKTETVTGYVDRIIEAPAECDPVIDDTIRMLKQATGIVNGTGNVSTTDRDTTGIVALLRETHTDKPRPVEIRF